VILRQRLRSLARRWVVFWDRREAPASLAVTRILLAMVVLSDLLIAKLQGAVPDLWVPPPTGMGETPEPSSLLAIPAAPLLLWATGVIAAFLLMVGALHRIAGAALTLALVMLPRFQPTGDGVDVLLRTVVPILALSSASACWSVDAWIGRRRGKPPPDEVPAWPRYLLMLQLLWVYSSSAQCRDDAAWWPWGGFSAIGHVLEDPHFARFSPVLLTGFYPLTQLATIATMVFELGAPFMLLWTLREPVRQSQLTGLARRLPWMWMVLGASLHLGIALTMTIGIFPFAMLALYPVFFHPEQLAGLHMAVRSAFGSTSN
jgi:hypothetical protein